MRSRVCAPPPPLTSQPAGSTWSAPSMARSRRSMSVKGRTSSPWARASSSVAGEVATQVMSRPAAPEHGHQLGDRRAGAQPDAHPVLDHGRPPPARRRASRPRCRASSPRADAQLRGTSFHGSSLSLRTSPGSPSTRSPRMLRMISEVPPSMELAAHPQEHLVHVGRAHADEVGPDHGVAGGEQHGVVAQQVHAEVVDPLVLLGEGELRHGALGTRRAGLASPQRRGRWSWTSVSIRM